MVMTSSPARTSLADDVQRVAPSITGGRSFLAAPVSRATWVAAGEAAIGFVSMFLGFALVIVLVVGVGLVPVLGIGVLIVVLCLLGARGLAWFERGRLAVQLGTPVAPPSYPPSDGKPWFSPAAWWRVLRDGRSWAHVGYLAVAPLLGTLRFAVLAGLGTAAAGIVVSAASTERWGLSRAVATLLAAVVGVWVASIGTQALALVQLRLARGLLGRPAAEQAQAEVLAATERADQAEGRAEHLTETRSRAVGAADEERRRIERDLHDGAQQRLVALGVELGSARRAAAHDPAAAAAALEHAHDEVKATLAELRDLVRGIHPAVLTDRGLDAALSALAARSPVPVVVEVTDPVAVGAASSAAQAAAYFVAAEALTNIAKHAQAGAAKVRVGVTGERLRLEVSDDGRGGATLTAGSGLEGLRARVEALDGSFDLTSPAGAGTRLTVEVPCAS